MLVRGSPIALQDREGCEIMRGARSLAVLFTRYRVRTTHVRSLPTRRRSVSPRLVIRSEIVRSTEETPAQKYCTLRTYTTPRERHLC
jgi:hypothetical protein